MSDPRPLLSRSLRIIDRHLSATRFYFPTDCLNLGAEVATILQVAPELGRVSA